MKRLSGFVDGRSAQINRPWFIKWPHGKLFSLFIFGVCLTASSGFLLAQPLGQNKIAREPYNYNAVCLFMDFAIASNIPPMDQILTVGRSYITQLKSDNYIAGILHAERNISLYKYQRPGIRAILFKNSSGVSVKDITLSANMIPKGLRSKKYLFGTFQIEGGAEPSLECDLYQMKLAFSGDTLDSLEITSSLD